MSRTKSKFNLWEFVSRSVLLVLLGTAVVGPRALALASTAVDGNVEAADPLEDTQGLSSQEEKNRATTVTTTTDFGFNYVATTPKIVVTAKNLSRYEQGLEDYDEAASRIESEQEQQQQQQQSQTIQQQYSSMLKPMLTLFNVISSALSSGRSMGPASGAENTGPTPQDTANNSNKSTDGSFGGKSTSTGGDNENETASATALSSGRYIKGDPLNGYYDYIISEGSYKFWVVVQLLTALLLIYATYSAIYYSKVNPVVSDYDYVDYLGGGRSYAGARSMRPTNGLSLWDRVGSQSWFGPAAQAFTLVMEAIEKDPKW